MVHSRESMPRGDAFRAGSYRLFSPVFDEGLLSFWLFQYKLKQHQCLKTKNQDVSSFSFAR